jgi:hypothetical protein
VLTRQQQEIDQLKAQNAHLQREIDRLSRRLG